MKRRIILILLMTLVPRPVLVAQAGDSARSRMQDATANPPIPIVSWFVTPPTFAEGIFPCSNCHAEMPPDLTRRVLQDEHTAIDLRHAAGLFWCLDCHHPENRDTLRLATGEGIPFTESYRLCGQCHSKKLRDWQAGIHGRRTGQWNGDKEYLLCTRCHGPHDPKFKALTPMPPPERPGRTGH